MIGQFKIVVPSFNSVAYLPKTLASIESQINKNYQVCVIDDCSTIAKQREIILDYCQRNDWSHLFHQKNVGPLASVLAGIRSFNCKDDDVIVMVDGDDWLYDEHVLEKLDKIYSNEDVYLTYGQFETYPPKWLNMNYAMPVPDIVIDQQMYREIVDIFGHLKTFKYRLFREIKDEDLRDPKTGEYFRVSGDKALLYPMLEMAGHKIRFNPDVVYVYNVGNPLSDFVINRPEQIENTNHIRSKPNYPKLKLDLLG